MSETPGSSPENAVAPEPPDAQTPTPEKRTRSFALRAGLGGLAIVICGSVLTYHFVQSHQDHKDTAGTQMVVGPDGTLVPESQAKGGSSGKAPAGAVPAPSPRGPVEACSALSEEEVRQVLGGVPACSSEPDDHSDAKYTLTGSAFLGGQGSINVSILPGVDMTFFSKYKKQSIAEDKSIAVSGLGEDAYYDDKLRNLTMFANSTQYSVQVLGLADPSGAALQAKESDLLKRMTS